MSQLTDAQLITEATVIKTETALGANTANRVGTMFVNSIDSKINVGAIDANTALGTSDSKIPTQNAVKAYADLLVAGLLRDRGNYDASSNLFPTTGGSGTGGAVMQGDLWYINVAGTLGGSSVLVGYSIRALVNTPGQTSTNWAILNVGLGFVPENVANKSTNVALGTSDTLYPSQNAVKSYVDNSTAGISRNNTLSGNNTFNGESFFNGELTVQGIIVENDLIVGQGEVTPIRLGISNNAGTSGQVLTSQGGAATPTWETPTPGISPASNTTFTGDITFNQNTEFVAGITTPLAGTSVFNGTLDVNYLLRANGSTGTAGQVLTSNGSSTAPTWQNAGAGGVTTVKVSLTSADILALSPISLFELIPAQGVGTFINVLKVYFVYNFNSIQYTPSSGGGGLQVLVGNAILGSIPVVTGSGVITGTNTILQRPPISNTTVSVVNYDNVAVNMYSNVSYYNGDGTLDVFITYDVITL